MLAAWMQNIIFAGVGFKIASRINQ
jgi:hypothetical protein